MKVEVHQMKIKADMKVKVRVKMIHRRPSIMAVKSCQSVHEKVNQK